MRELGYEDEPQQSGAVVAVNYGDYREQEIWVRSGSNIGNWYCLGGEFGRPRPWDDPRTDMQRLVTWRGPEPKPGPGEIVRHPHWDDILARGPVTLLFPGDEGAYKTGWANGRRRLREQIEEMDDDD